MAFSAFKSSTRRGNPANTSSSAKTLSDKESRDNSSSKSSKNVSSRRSRSVSASARSNLDVSSSSTSEFLNKRDNPLFWSGGGNNNGVEVDEIVLLKKDVDLSSKSVGAADGSRGRSTSRDGGVGQMQVGRSLSRVDTGRRGRSASQCPVSRRQYINSESEAEQEINLSSKHGSRSNQNGALNCDGKKKSNIVRSSSDVLDKMKSPGFRSSRSPSGTLDFEDGVSTSSYSEAEEKTIKAVFEQMKGDNLGGDGPTSGIYETVRSEVRRAISDIQNDLESAIRRSNAAAIATTSVTDIPPDLVNPAAVELVSDIRREYAKKLEQSQERARKLRADLAVEEHRELELSRILKEVLPDPKSSSLQKSRPGRKASIERRKMSKRLTEEAMAYFDECVSISTFDSSDFSSQEDPPISSVGVTTPVGEHISLSQVGSSISITRPCSRLNDKQELSTKGLFMESHGTLEPSAGSSSRDPTLDHFNSYSSDREQGCKFQFSFSPKSGETFELQEDIKKYVRDFEKDPENVNIKSKDVRSSQYDLEENSLYASRQSLLFDRVIFKNRTESGSMLLCGGCFASALSPFASAI
ncbi:uncharacterized protein LOC119989050 isoform X2 [Tripterygium wilfordii]|uniref:uncharacterized protein LOC119989050 isoform X2 n=1 Tax=Tripterygium wilfordii TaxID=458696 RepID=UPI0018F85DDF|nr:uncharacterized protein LOC119989050 isoform X2 [Tripterygium wilfordii]